jgi:hypothetical protein
MSNKGILILSILGILIAACSQVTIAGSGNVVSQEMEITGFDKLDISQGFDVDITQGEDFKVVIRVDDNIEEFLQVEKNGSTLKIGLEQNRIYGIATMQAEITMPNLMGLETSGGSRATATGNGNDISIDASGGSISDLSSFPVFNANIEASGASQVTVNASGTINVDASGASQVYYLGNPTLGKIDTSGASQVESK